ncbi:hypothetical protein ASZ90_011248 [hydrocarbon metagenome]|uniref:Uncharacterized protein n=1 Tax=hydrocarbon metagenome TaxID=938273 RepID=A0A0W8FFI3_9ZZZZ
MRFIRCAGISASSWFLDSDVSIQRIKTTKTVSGLRDALPLPFPVCRMHRTPALRTLRRCRLQ